MLDLDFSKRNTQVYWLYLNCYELNQIPMLDRARSYPIIIFKENPVHVHIYWTQTRLKVVLEAYPRPSKVPSLYEVIPEFVIL